MQMFENSKVDANNNKKSRTTRSKAKLESQLDICAASGMVEQSTSTPMPYADNPSANQPAAESAALRDRQP